MKRLLTELGGVLVLLGAFLGVVYGLPLMVWAVNG